MCTMESSNLFQSVNKSIIKKEIIRTDSWESDCISWDGDDDHNHQSSSSHIDASTQTITAYCPSPCCNNDNLLSGNISQNLSPVFSPIPRIYQRSNREQFHSHSTSPYHKTNDQQHLTAGQCRSRSQPTLVETLTDDSGTGESMVHVPPAISTETEHYEVVPVFGQTGGKVAIMANRYDFDPMKIKAYGMKKSKNLLKPSFMKPPPHSTIEITSRQKRATTIHDLPTSKSHTIVSRLIRVLRPSSTDRTSAEPIFRHHSSHNTTNDEQ